MLTLSLAHPAMGQDEGDTLPGVDIPDGYVLIVSLFRTTVSGRMGVTIYTLGVVRDEYSNTILSAQRALIASESNQLVSAYQIIVFTAEHEVLSSDNLEQDSRHYSKSKGITISISDEPLLPIDPQPPEIVYDYQPAPDDVFDGILLMSGGNSIESEPLSIQSVEFTLLPLDKTTNYHPVYISSPLPPQEIYNGFALKDGKIVGLILMYRDDTMYYKDGILFFVPIDSVLCGLGGPQ
ncbi:hypothetical protein A2810_02770 [candidate division Kazan bacterium RIFCSPHIGHO2_01_FULL_49_10]|uniref:Uncharacterized protein n=1 Tax=candidate division Kazan bacterium RIFCSPLOWO2_01_FULL_48_13 TaxID=1798539 RepID=A0A1F4PMJ3_UNCK3|nr:MAG: hypothetical protein A2810_02770 [candidate division Kazan bacterium RIFCSPHIGHO2_01_FULL_49_10]OGB84864.1 MAG: hypothetical protein A2994_01615 [candidate division Kazan bacterium RIFCSPLOWO2_01_FULL_48_13]